MVQTPQSDSTQIRNGDPSASPEEPTLGYVAPIGTEVRTVDGDVLGQVIATWPSYVFVEAAPGTDAGYWVPVEEFGGTEGASLLVRVSREEAQRRGWTERPSGGPEEHR